ncbi:MAG TPA: thioredoxin family protein [Thermoanaerobaculia bacterium]|jgi:thiol:disulfide interchange protein|nr:thioredoxin family protein [Thermoanaerobaculia bacterium]
MAQTSQTNQKYIPVILIVIVVALVAGRMTSQWLKKDPPAPEAGLVKWVPLDDAMRLAATTNKPLLIDFTAEWCGPCHTLDAQVFRDASLAAQINERFIPVRVTDRMQEEGRNRPEVDELQRRFSVRGFPTVVIADAGGTERARMDGFGGRERFEQMLEQTR